MQNKTIAAFLGWFSQFSGRAVGLSLAHPWRVVLGFLILLGVGTAGSSQLGIRLNYLELLPEDDAAVVDLRWMLAKAGGEGYLATGVRGGTREARMAFSTAWAEFLSTRPDFRYAEFHHDAAYFRTNAASLLPLATLVELREKLQAAVRAGVERSMSLGIADTSSTSSTSAELERLVHAYESAAPSEYVEDATHSEFFVLAKPAFESSDLGRVESVLAGLRQAADQRLAAPEYAGIEVGFGGPMVFQRAFDNGVRGDLGRVSLWSLILAASFLFIALRRPLAVLVVIVPIVVSIAMTLAFAALWVGHLTIISGILVAVLLGLGVEFGLHLVLRTAEARETMPMREALLVAGRETMDGAFSGAITNAAAFAVLLGCNFRAFREFGAIAAVGILLSWLFTYALVPALILLIESRLPGWVVQSRREGLKPLVVPRALRWAILVAFPCVAAYGALDLEGVKFERSFDALYDDVPDPVGQRASAAMSASLTPVVCWVSSLADARKLKTIVDEVRAADRNPLGPSLGSSFSLADLIHDDDGPARAEELARISTQLDRIPAGERAQNQARIDELERMLAAPRVGLAELPIEFRRRFQALDGDGTLMLITPARSMDESDELDAYVVSVEKVLALARSRGMTTHFLSENRIAVRIFREVYGDAPFIGWVSMLVVLATLFLLLRTVRETLLVFLPIALGMLAMLAGLELGHIKLNFINIAVIPSIFTVAIDNTVHLYHRYREDGRAAMPTILRHTGLAILMATCVNASGYVPALLATFYGLRTLGWVAASGMAAMLVSTVLWFPALLMTVPEKKRLAKPGPRESLVGTPPRSAPTGPRGGP